MIPRFLTRLVKIPKAIDKIPNRVGPLGSLCDVKQSHSAGIYSETIFTLGTKAMMNLK